MGGSDSIEFMIRSEAGEDWIAICDGCGYAANFEKATSELEGVADEVPPETPEKFATPGLRTIEDLAAAGDGAPPERQIKTLVYVVDGKTVLILLRGDHQLVEQKAPRPGGRGRDPARESERDSRGDGRVGRESRRGRRFALRHRGRGAARTHEHGDRRERRRLPSARRRHRAATYR